MRFKQFARLAHRWLMLPMGLIVALICFTGAILVVETDIINLVTRPSISPQSNPLGVDELLPSVERSLDSGVAIVSLTIAGDDLPYQVALSKPRRAGLYVNQYTGEVLGRSGQGVPFFSTVRKLHRWIGLSKPDDGGIFWGRYIVAVSVIGMILAILTGIWLWWPRTWRSAREQLKIRFNRGWKVLWRSLHVATGLYFALLIILLGLTGLTWSFQGWNRAVYSLFGGDKPGANRDMVEETTPDPDSRYDTWAKQLNSPALNLSGQTHTVSDGLVKVQPSGWGAPTLWDEFYFAPDGETCIAHLGPETQSGRAKVGAWIRSLHFGTWGGWFSKLLYIAATLTAGALPLTGYYIYFQRRINKARARANT